MRPVVSIPRPGKHRELILDIFVNTDMCNFHQLSGFRVASGFDPCDPELNVSTDRLVESRRLPQIEAVAGR
jgi:hypothetical protein